MFFYVLNKASKKDILQIKTLYEQAGWWSSKDNLNLIKKIIKGSYLFAVIYNDKSDIIAMARVISDGVNDAYIQDFTVLKKYRNRGIGYYLIKNIINILKERGFKWIGLISTKKALKLYKKAGFKIYRNMYPMICAENE